MAAPTTAARAPRTRMASTAPTTPTAACADRCKCRQPGHPPTRASAWRRASAPIALIAGRTLPCNRRRRLWLYRLHRLQGCRPMEAVEPGLARIGPILAASRPARPRRPRQSQRPLRRWRHRPHPRHRRRCCTPPRRPCTHAKSTPLSRARWVDSLASSRWCSLRWLASSYGWWGCLHCVLARCETGRKEHVGVGEEGRSRDVLNGGSGWLSSSASTGWRALNPLLATSCRS